MILPIYLYGHPVLRKVTKDIPLDYPNLETLLDNMFDTLNESKGIGLAAPQIGLEDRILVVDLSAIADRDPAFKDFKRVFINAHIIERDGAEEIIEEGCLSIPDIHEKVPRKHRIRIQYLDEHLQPHDEIFEAFKARVIQHEYDHLEGIMFIDHIFGIRKQMIRSKLNDIIRGDVKCSYHVKSKPDRVKK
ncbi:MAG: peptide deformylase [Dysgonamonadaceae bacterium]|jgi:peptide deformylase|nr:peptide deformylase [Dysgonamonadaceae bacterium]